MVACGFSHAGIEHHNPVHLNPAGDAVAAVVERDCRRLSASDFAVTVSNPNWAYASLSNPASPWRTSAADLGCSMGVVSAGDVYAEPAESGLDAEYFFHPSNYMARHHV